MPRLAGNFSMMFGEVEMLKRFELAAGVGFRGAEIQHPYEQTSAEIGQAFFSACTDQQFDLLVDCAAEIIAGELDPPVAPGGTVQYGAQVRLQSNVTVEPTCPSVEDLPGAQGWNVSVPEPRSGFPPQYVPVGRYLTVCRDRNSPSVLLLMFIRLRLLPRPY